MSRDLFVHGETLVQVKGRSDSAIGSLSQLGLPDAPIRIRPTFRHTDVNADAWGQAPFENQFMLAFMDVSMSLVHVDRDILDACEIESMASAGVIGALPHAGARMGNNLPRFAASTAADPNGIVRTGNHYIGLNLSAPVSGKPWRFFYSYLTGPPLELPIGTERSIFVMNWRVVPYSQDPYNGGLGALGQLIWDHSNDT